MSGAHTSDCIIIGSGLVGAAMAIACARIGLRVDIIDATDQSVRTDAGYDGRTSAIAYGSQKVLEALGVWQKIDVMEPITDIRVCDGDARPHVHYDCREAGDKPFGHIVENRLLRETLYDTMCGYDIIARHEPAVVETLEQAPHCVKVTLNNGRKLSAPLMLVCDGKLSKTRDRLGIEADWFEYGQTAIVCTVKHSEPHHGVAIERFLPAGPFAVLPMTEQRSNIVWSETDAMAARMMQLDDAEFLEELKPRIGDYLGDITLAGPRYSYPLKLILAKRYTDARVALVGDSAHGIHPIAGQGVNLGYRDVAVLAELLEKQARLGLDIGAESLLQDYQRWRKTDVTSMAYVTDGLNRLFSNNILPLKIARIIGLGAVNRLKPVKHFFMRSAMGMVGNLPAMMRDDHSTQKAS